MGKSAAKRIVEYLWYLIPAAVAFLLYLILPHFSGITETMFTKGIFRIIGVPLGWLIQWLPFSLSEIIVLLLIPAVITFIVIFIRLIIKKRFSSVRNLSKAILLAVSCLLLMYMLMHGVNFYRKPAAELLGLDVHERSSEELAELTAYLAQNASSIRASLPENENGTAELTVSVSDILKSAGKGYTELDDQFSELWGAVTRTKPVQISHLWSYTGITGMYFPFLAEANVNIDQTVYCIPFTASHELAHTRGFAREDECNFFGFLASINNDSPDFQYSGYYLAYIDCFNALYSKDSDLAIKTARENVSEAMARDLNYQNEYWHQFDGPVQDVSNNANDKFIQYQGVEDGVQSYGRCIDLILAWYAETK
jgi:hypothetical protein